MRRLKAHSSIKHLAYSLIDRSGIVVVSSSVSGHKWWGSWVQIPPSASRQRGHGTLSTGHVCVDPNKTLHYGRPPGHWTDRTGDDCFEPTTLNDGDMRLVPCLAIAV